MSHCLIGGGSAKLPADHLAVVVRNVSLTAHEFRDTG